MNKTTFLSILKNILLFGSVFMLGEFVVHISSVRLLGAEQTWPVGAILFVKMFMFLWAGASLLLAALLFEIQRKILYYRPLLDIMAWYCFFHGGILWYLSFQYLPELLPSPAMYIWNPYYSFQLKIEGSILFAFALFYLWGKKRKFLAN